MKKIKLIILLLSFTVGVYAQSFIQTSEEGIKLLFDNTFLNVDIGKTELEIAYSKRIYDNNLISERFWGIEGSVKNSDNISSLIRNGEFVPVPKISGFYSIDFIIGDKAIKQTQINDLIIQESKIKKR